MGALSLGVKHVFQKIRKILKKVSCHIRLPDTAPIKGFKRACANKALLSLTNRELIL